MVRSIFPVLLINLHRLKENLLSTTFVLSDILKDKDWWLGLEKAARAPIHSTYIYQYTGCEVLVLQYLTPDILLYTILRPKQLIRTERFTIRWAGKM